MTTAKNNPIKEDPSREIINSRTFDAPREIVWQALTDMRHLFHWWGPDGFTTTTSEMDVRPDGKWIFVMHGPDGKNYDNLITYHEVTEPERLVYTHGSPKEPKQFEMIATLTEEKGKTTLTWRSIFPSAAACENIKKSGAVECGKQTLARLADYLPKVVPPDREIVISRLVDAPPEMVWDAMTDPKQVVKWCGPQGFGTTIEEMDVRPGGVWKHIMRGPDGAEYPNKSIFKEVVKPERLVYSHAGGKKGVRGVNFISTWTFEKVGHQTRVTINMVFPEAKDRAFVVKQYGAIEGGKQTLQRLNDQFTKLSSSAPNAIPEQTDRDFVISRVFSAPRELVWQAWTDPKHMAQWWGPHQFTNTCEMDLSVGGVYRIIMHSPDGDNFPLKGVFREISRPSRLVMTANHSDLPDSWHDAVNPGRDKSAGRPGLEGVITVTFEVEGQNTKVTVHERFESAAVFNLFAKLGMNGGWSQSFERLESLLAKKN